MKIYILQYNILINFIAKIYLKFLKIWKYAQKLILIIYQYLNIKKNNMKTAVEWLTEKYNYITWLRNRDEISEAKAEHLKIVFFKEAIEMEKQLLINAHGNKEKKSGGVTNYTYILTGEEYYNETFNKNK